MEDKSCVICGGSGILPERKLCVCVQKSLLRRIYGVLYPWSTRDVKIVELAKKLKPSCVIYPTSKEKARRVVLEFLLMNDPLVRNFVLFSSSDLIADYLSREEQLIDEVLPAFTVIEVGNLSMPNKQEMNLVLQFIKDRRNASKFIVLSYNRMEFQKYAREIRLKEYAL